MPPDRTTAGSSKPKPFKPVRPAANTTSSRPKLPTTTASSSSARPSNNDHEDLTTVDLADDDDTSIDTTRATIPPELLTRLLHEFFTEEGGMRISKGADRAVGKYMETFVREAIARAAFERGGAEGGGGGGFGGFMEVEDLEKLAPQLVLDF